MNRRTRFVPVAAAAMAMFAVALATPVLNSQAPAAAAPTANSAPAGDTGSGSRAHDDKFVIGVDDVLAINVWKEDAISRSVPVRSDGKISLPLAGELQAEGRTPMQLEADITERLKNYITAPAVTVMVTEIHSQKFNIMGQVAKPGAYSLTQANTIMDAIAAAGGFKDFAKQKNIYILRPTANGSETRINFNYKDFIKGKNPGQNIRLEPHDTIVVP